MDSSVFETALYALGCGILGVFGGWLVQARIGKRLVNQVTVQKDLLANKVSRSEAKIETLQDTVAKQSTEFEAVLRKSKQLTKNILALRAERENTKSKLSTIQSAAGSLRKQTTALQSEFAKSQEFYKRELVKSFEKRKLLEKEVEEARSEQEAFARRVESASAEHGSEESMIVAAQLRLGQLKVLERNVNKLEGENADLNRDLVRIKQELQAREREVAELDRLKIHNKELVRCVEALEGSRKEHETDAERYRRQADQSEKLSDTLRLKLDDLQKNFADIEKQQDQALEDVRKAPVVPILKNQR